MQMDRIDHGEIDQGWSAGPRRRVVPTVAVAAAVGGIVGALVGRLIESAVLPGASFAVIALSVVGIAAGVLSATSLIRASDEPHEDDRRQSSHPAAVK